MDKTEYERAWNAAIEVVLFKLGFDPTSLGGITAPSEYFDEWYEREVANPPEGWENYKDD